MPDARSTGRIAWPSGGCPMPTRGRRRRGWSSDSGRRPWPAPCSTAASSSISIDRPGSPGGPSMDRREFFSWVRGGLAGAAAASLMLRDGTAQAGVPGEAHPACPHFAPRAKRALHICLCGAMSHVDSFDHKPGLIAAHGQSLKTSTRPDVFFGKVGRLRKSDWEFRQRGDSGLWISDLFPILGEVADELTVIRSMVADTANHTPATFQENSGFRLNGFPAMGAWLS